MSALRGKRVLVIEDEAIVAMMVEDVLAEVGAKVIGQAGNLEDALELARTRDFDVALLDLNLNGKRSDAVADILTGRGLPFVVATGYGVADGRKSMRAEIVEKPYRPEQLFSALVRAIGG